jgi:hypothetical protein
LVLDALDLRCEVFDFLPVTGSLIFLFVVTKRKIMFDFIKKKSTPLPPKYVVHPKGITTGSDGEEMKTTL